MVLVLLHRHRLQSQRADGAGTVRHSLWGRCIKRCLAPTWAMHEVRTQGRDDDGTGCGDAGVSGRSVMHERMDSMKRKKIPLPIWFHNLGGWKPARSRFTERHFDPYTKAIGSVLLAWNDRHERLGLLFVHALGPKQIAQSSTIWHKTRSDSNKRAYLKAAVENLAASAIGDRKELVEDVAWIIEKTNHLEGYRDDSAHTPFQYEHAPNLMMLLEAITGTNPLPDPTVAPDTSFANPRAMRLAKREMLIEYRYARERILVLRDFAIAIQCAWWDARLPWPERPALPERRPSRRSNGRASRRKRK
jgi:hypothetical protein